MRVDDVAQALLVIGVLGQAQGPERQGGALADLTEIDGNELDAAAAEIADDAVGLRNPGDDAERREMPLGGAVEDIDGNPAAPRRFGDELAPIARIAHGGGGDDVEPRHPDGARERDEALQILQRRRDGVGIEAARPFEAAAETAQYFLVEQSERRAADAIVDDEPKRIRPDVDDGDATAESHGGGDLVRRFGPVVEHQTRRRLGAAERATASRQAGVGHEIGMRAKRLVVQRRAGIGAFAVEEPALGRILEVGDHDLVEHLTMDGWVLNRHQGLDAPVEIARHPVRRGDEDLGVVGWQLVAVGEADDAAMLEEAADDALDADILGQAGHPGPQAADAADDEVDLNPRHRG